MEVWGDIQVDEGGAWITPKGPKLSHDSVSVSKSYAEQVNHGL
jgi:hypothetical protein